ncbi:MAG: alpha/beta-type small acid-soluble spore protein [Defluviitaleaceae bacterium]|nr:alpha/beta-type small acid-soluble spore protein [Defluviitaleaceae bacterium]
MARYEKTQNMKTEIANEFGVQLGPDATSRQNGSVGGEITKRLVSQALGQTQTQKNQSE